MSKTYNYKVSYRKVSESCEWTIIPNISLPCTLNEVEESSDGTLSVIVFTWNGICPALMEGRRLISKYCGVAYL